MAVLVFITTWHSLHPSHTTMDGWLARRRTLFGKSDSESDSESDSVFGEGGMGGNPG